MSNNPYEPPKAPVVTEGQSRARNSLLWKIYFWFNLIITIPIFIAVSFSYVVALLHIVDIIVLLLSVVELVGLFGFAYYKAIGGMVFWRYFFYIALIIGTIYSLALPLLGIPRIGQLTAFDIWFLCELVLVILTFYALYQYAYRRPFIWQGS